MIHNNINKITRNFDHRNGIVTENKPGKCKLNVGYHTYINPYNFLSKPPVGSVGVVKPVQAKNNPVVWTPDTGLKRTTQQIQIDNQTSNYNYTPDTYLGTFSPFGTPPYYNSYEIFQYTDTFCPPSITLNLASQKRIPVAMKVENISGNFAAIWIYLGWSESREIGRKTYIVYKHYFSYGYVPVNSPYFMNIPYYWYLWGCSYFCEEEGAWEIRAFKEPASKFELIKRVKNGGTVGIYFMIAVGLRNSPCGVYYYTNCVYPLFQGCCTCDITRVSVRITVYYQNNHPDWDRVR